QECRALGNLGRAYRQLGNAEDAAKYHKRELYLAQELGDRFKEAAALDSLGDTYWQLQNVEQAVEFYKQSLALARQIEDRARVKSILSSMGRVYLHAGNTKESVALFHQALSLARKIGDRVGKGEALADLGYLYYTLSYKDRAIEFYNQALKIAQESRDKRREAITLASIAEIRQEMEELPEAKQLFEASLAAAEEIDDQLKQMEVLRKLGEVYNLLGDFMHGASLHKRAMALAQGIGMREIERQTLFDLGRDYEKWGDLGRAIEYYQQHLAVIEEQDGGWQLKKDVIAKFGPLYAKLKQFRTSIEASEHYLEQSRAHGDRHAEVDALQQMGLVYRVVADTGKAINYYRDALNVARDIRDVEAEALAMGSLALTYYDMGRKWQATRSMEKAMSRAEESGSPSLIATSAYRLALILCRQKKWGKAQSYADQAYELFHELKNESMLERANKLLDAIDEQKDRATGFLS
ncbi:MAG: tetratricopeptide repeat protein, partial [Anaerolineales bacterium]|nr:tetratricopeptide repeat protein [Anaerolineales bacterium]